MHTRKTFHRSLLALLIGACAAAAPALAQINININIGPPALQFEAVPMLAPGYTWAPGYWAWAGERHVWVRGRVILERVGYRWAPDRWERRDQVYFRHAGRWEPDPGYRAVKVKKEKKSKHRDDDDDDRRHGKGKGKSHDRD